MPLEISGPFKQEIQKLEEKRKLIDKEREAIEEKSKYCEIIKTEVIKELEKEYNLESFKEFKKEFGDLLTLLDEYLRTGEEESKQAALKKIPILNDLIKW